CGNPWGNIMSMIIGTDIESNSQIEIPTTTREQGFYIIGRRGMGKSTLLESLIAQDIASGHGVGVFDPHGSLIEAVINRIPDDRINVGVFLDASDPEHAFGLNLFDLAGLSGQAQVRRAVDQVVQTFKKVWGVGEDASWGPLLE